ncbi:MAG: ABC transporter permease subunit, partial [Roseiflexaceae bacterium]
MANEAVKLRQPVARRWPRLPYELRLVLWWCVWLLILLFLFSGTQIALGPIQIKTITLDWSFIGEWWQFISWGVVITFKLSIISMVCAVVLALSAALARLSRVASLNSFANLYVSLMRGTPLFLQFIFI